MAIALGSWAGCARDEQDLLPAADGSESDAFGLWLAPNDLSLGTLDAPSPLDPIRWSRAGVQAVVLPTAAAHALSGAFRAAGIEVHDRRRVLRDRGDASLVTEHPEWFTVSRAGQSSASPDATGDAWLCPSRSEVRAFLVDEVGAAAADPRVDGVVLDGLRHSPVDAMAPDDFCFCEVCRAQFADLGGRDPMALAEPGLDGGWQSFRRDTLTALVRGLAGAVHARGKPLATTVFATPDEGRARAAQSWDEWPVDRLVPRVRPPAGAVSAGWLADRIDAAIDGLDLGDRRILPALELSATTPAALSDLTPATRDAGVAGLLIVGPTEVLLDTLDRGGTP